MRKVKQRRSRCSAAQSCRKIWKKQKRKSEKRQQKEQILFYCRNFLNGNISVSRDGMIFIIMQNRQKKTKQYRWECVWQRTWSRASDQLYEKEVNNLYNSIACIDADGRILGIYRKHISQMTTIIRKNFILRRAIPDFVSLRPDMERSASEFAGISGFRRVPDAWHFRVQNFCFIRLLSVQANSGM